MKVLKFTQTGYENYSGPIGPYEFVDGVSVTAIPRNDRDRLAAAFQFDEVDENGESCPAGVAHRLIAESAVRADMGQPLERQTEAEKEIENAMAQIAGEEVRRIYAEDELFKIADKKGINGLREIAEIWEVKHRSIPDLIKLILNAQKTWCDIRSAELERRGISEAAIAGIALIQPTKKLETELTSPEPAPVAPAPVAPAPVEPEPEPATVSAAAASGDMSAALSLEEKGD